MSRSYIIAEAGVNHNGSVEMAKALIDAAAEAGADAVKFQTFNTEKLVTKAAQKADYQKETTGSDDGQFEMLKRLELSHEAHRALFSYAQSRGIDFLSTPFDKDSLDFLINEFDLPMIKVPSGEITNAPFLLDIARTGKNVIISTGMSTLGEVEQALMMLAYGFGAPHPTPSFEQIESHYLTIKARETLARKVTILHCTSSYPTPFGDVNLQAMDTLHRAFGLPVGLSDHSPGISVPIGAAARGAAVIEKHFTLDKTLPGPDHLASLNPEELRLMVQYIREVEQALGSPVKNPTPVELRNRLATRKSLVAQTDIQPGELFSAHNLTVKRPGTGVSPLYYWDRLGKPATRAYAKDEPIE